MIPLILILWMASFYYPPQSSSFDPEGGSNQPQRILREMKRKYINKGWIQMPQLPLSSNIHLTSQTRGGFMHGNSDINQDFINMSSDASKTVYNSICLYSQSHMTSSWVWRNNLRMGFSILLGCTIYGSLVASGIYSDLEDFLLSIMIQVVSAQCSSQHGYIMT